VSHAAVRSWRHQAVRPLIEDDLGALVELHGQSFGRAPGITPEAVRSHLFDLFLGHPWLDAGPGSLVYEDEAGEIVGCLGVMPRPMRLGDQPVRAVVSHNFMVAPNRRSTLAAMALLRAHLERDQELSLAVGNEASRRLWRAMGGTTSLAYSLRWWRPLRPATHLINKALRRRRRRALALLRPLARLLDRVASAPASSPLRTRRPELEAEPLDAPTLADCVERLGASSSLRPCYDGDTVASMWRIFARCPGRGPLRGSTLRERGRICGWYLYSLERGGTAEVLQLGANADRAVDVFDHLCWEARTQGANMLAGQLEPAWMPTFSQRPCFFDRGAASPWVLVHSRAESLLRPFLVGDAFFSRLEGEWWA
jgi:hypothetical protein